MKAPFRKRLRNKERLLGTLVTLPVPEVVELAVGAGFDWLFIDMEHGALDVRSVQQLLQTASDKIECVIRCPGNEEVWIKKCLDLGAAGVIVPQVKNAAEAEQAVQFSKYPPVGSRSVGVARAQGFGLRFQEYVTTANEDVALIIQVEHIDAVENIDEITNVSEIDCVFVGPYDLSGSIGKIGEVTSPEVLRAICRIRESCQQKGLPLGIFAATADGIQSYMREGYSLLTVGIDSTLLGKSYHNLVETLRK